MTAKELFEQAERKLHRKEFRDSIKLYSEAIALEGDNAHYISQRAVAFFHLGEYEEALYDFNRALELEPENPFRYSSRAYLLSNIGQIEDAIRDYEKAIALDPDDSVAHNNLGLLQERIGFDELAKKHFEKADSIEGIELIGNKYFRKEDEPSEPEAEKREPVIDPPPETLELGKNYMEVSYFRFIRMIFTHKKIRRDFFRFIRNGFKLD